MVLASHCRHPSDAIRYSPALVLVPSKVESMKTRVAPLIAIGCITVTTLSQTPEGLEGKWEGTLVAGPNQLRLVLNITRTSDGLHLGTMTSVDQGGVRIPMDIIQLTGGSS
jgi:hypothetical protein